MHIAFRVPRFHTNMSGWVELLQDSGHTVSLLVDRAEPIETRHKDLLFVAPVLWRKRVGKTRKGPNSGAPTVSLRKWLRTVAPDVLIVRDFNSAGSLQALALGLLLNLKTVLYLQIRSLGELHFAHSLAIRFFCAVTRTRILSPLLTTGRQPMGRWNVVPFLPLSGFFRTDVTEETPANLRLLSVGKFVERKRHDLALECLHNLHHSGALAASLTVVGEISTEEHRFWQQRFLAETHERGLSKWVVVDGNVAPSRMPELLRSHDVLLMLSENEPAAMIVLEALAAGLVVVVREDNRTSGFVRSTGAGSILLSDTPISLDEALGHALSALRRTTRTDRRICYRRFFGPAAVKSAWDELLAPGSLR